VSNTMFVSQNSFGHEFRAEISFDETTIPMPILKLVFMFIECISLSKRFTFSFEGCFTFAIRQRSRVKIPMS
jgi:hypothetical protein